MNEAVFDLERYEDGAPVKQVIVYEFVEDFDFVPYGESEVMRDTSYIEVKHTYYECNGKKYIPTAEELRDWEDDLEDLASDHYQREVA